MSSEPEVVLHRDAENLARMTADRTVATLGLALAQHHAAHLVVTGGSILEAVLAELPAATERAPIDWSRVHVWWGDERYVDADSDDRNDRPARAKAFDHLDIAAGHLHPMPAADAGFGDDLDAAADSYAAELAAAADADAAEAEEAAKSESDADTSDDADADAADADADAVNAGAGQAETEAVDNDAAVSVPRFAVILLGLGPDGHCASLFPGHPGTRVTDAAVIGVRESPKPPPDRLSLTFTGLDAADEIWFIASGAGKAEAVARALGGAPREEVPSAGPRGRNRTLWLLDEAAAADFPH